MAALTKDFKACLQNILEEVAAEISQNGADSLWNPNQFITGARIIIEIDADMITTIRYEKDVFPAPRG